MGKRFVLGVIGAFVMALAAPAQVQFQVGPDALTAGGDADISFKDASRAGMTIIVEVENGSSLNPQYDYILITLDGNGNGSGSWHVPEGGWQYANFMAPGASPKTFPVNSTPPGPPPPSTV